MIDLYDGEKILLQRRRHWYAIASESIILFVAAILPAILLLGGFIYEEARGALLEFLPLIIFAASVWFLLLWEIFFVLWTDYYLDVFVITNKRIIDIEQRGLFARDMAEVKLGNIQDIKVEVLGFIASTLDFGNVHIQTAGESREVVLKKIPKPDEVREVISRQLHQIN